MSSHLQEGASRLDALNRKASAIAVMEALLQSLDALGAGLVACHQSLALELLRDWSPEAEAGSSFGARNEQGHVSRQ
jgi:hypothetical protein